MASSYWFKRLVRDCKKISKHIRFKRVRDGFYRIYWKDAYMHEVYDNLPYRGYDIEVPNPRLENQQYFEEYEDSIDIIRNVKNYVEGYSDALDTIRTRVYLHRHNAEFNENAKNAYKKMVVK